MAKAEIDLKKQKELEPVNFHVWLPTSKLRILKSTGALQQAWQDKQTGAIRWQDVPTVDE